MFCNTTLALFCTIKSGFKIVNMIINKVKYKATNI